jgi:hypothetical protein
MKLGKVMLATLAVAGIFAATAGTSAFASALAGQPLVVACGGGSDGGGCPGPGGDGGNS